MNELRSKISLSADTGWGTQVTAASGADGIYYLQLNAAGCKTVELYIPVEGVTPYRSPDGKVAANEAITKLLDKVKVTTKSPARQFQRSDDKYKSYTSTVKSTDYLVTIKLPNTTEPSSVAVISVVYDKTIVEQLTVIISGQLELPTINNFITSRGVLVTNDNFTLSWDVKNADSIALIKNEQPVALPAGATSIQQKLNLITEAKYELIATNIKGAVSQPLTVKGSGVPGVRQLQQFADDKKLLNLFTCDDTAMLYALVLDAPVAGAGENVFLWQSTDGCNWDNSNMSFSNSDELIPAKVAESSSVVWKGRVYLIGGSRFDPNEQSNDVYSFDLVKPGKWIKENSAPFDPRMGQAALVVKARPTDEGEIWVLGGYGQTGTVDDIYIYNGQWKKSNETMGTKLCMHNVVLDEGGINVMGGFSDSPGMPDRSLTDARRYNLQTNTWAGLNWQKGQEPIMDATKTIAFAFEKIDGMRFVFGSYRGAMNTILASLITPVGAYNIESVGVNFLTHELTATLQAVYFKKAIWFCVANDEGTLSTQDIWYFVYQDKFYKTKI